MRKKGRKVQGAWSELSGWVLVLIVLVVLLIIIAAASGKLDVSFLQRISG